MLIQDVSLWVAFLAGVVSFLSPCILPMIPAYVSYMSGSMNLREKSLISTLTHSLFFIIGFSIIFIIMGASASYLGQLFYDYKYVIQRIAGILIVLFGLHTMGLLKISFLYRQIRFQGPRKVTGWSGATLMGMAFGAGWTPCVGTVLSSILLYASTTGTVNKGVYLLIAYSLGLGVPFILAALVMYFFGRGFTGLNRYTPIISKISGGVMVILGIMIYFDLLILITRYYFIYFG